MNIPNQTTESDAADAKPEDFVNELQTIVADIDTFLSRWLERIHADKDSMATRSPSEALQQRMDEFLEERRGWEAKRDFELRKIEENTNQLTEAWLRLESEQRRFLQTKNQQPPATRVRSSDSNTEPLAQTRLTVLDREEPLPSGGEAGRITNTAVADPKSDTAIQQFRRLKREIDRGRSGSSLF